METRIKRPLSPARVTTISIVMFLLLLLVTAISMMIGTAEVSLSQIKGLFTGVLQTEDPARLIIFRVRLPRIMLAGIVGFSLSLGGVIFQALYEILWQIPLSWVFPADRPSVPYWAFFWVFILPSGSL